MCCASRAQLVSTAAKYPGSPRRADQDLGHWIHPLPGPEKGAILIAHPLMFTTSQTYFSHSVRQISPLGPAPSRVRSLTRWVSQVIFVFEHSAIGSSGLILNRPTQYSIREVQGTELLRPEFEGNRLLLGGDMGPETIHVLHAQGDLQVECPPSPNGFHAGTCQLTSAGLNDGLCSDIVVPRRCLQGAVEIIDGVYLGGFEAAKRKVSSGDRKVHGIVLKCKTAVALGAAGLLPCHPRAGDP